MYASLNYIQTRAPYGVFEGQAPQDPESKAKEKEEKEKDKEKDKDKHKDKEKPKVNGTAQANGEAVQDGLPTRHETGSPPPEKAEIFDATIREMARDLVMKEQQIELIINSLPGLGSNEVMQENRMRELEIELKDVEAERVKKEGEKDAMINLLGEIIGKVKRIP